MKIALFVLAILFAIPAGAQPLAEQPIAFAARSGESVTAFRGSIAVPENRSDPHSRTIELSYVRFPATTESPGPPIVYLAGGPGGSGSMTAQGDRFPLFMAMRAHGDVIAFDQRGTGASTQLPRCTSSIEISATEPLSDDAYAELYRSAARECRAFWEAEGVDLRGYTTRESVSDLSALRRHLGSERIALWGISYGSHLALAAIAAISEELDRVVIASAEGLDQTVKLPARTDSYFARLQGAIDAQPRAAALYPDIMGLVRRVHARLDRQPMQLQIRETGGQSSPFLLQRRHLQEIASGMIADPANAALMLALYRSLDDGETGLASGLIGAFGGAGDPISLWAMPTAMDVASGISEERLQAFDRQRDGSLLGGYLNFPMPQLRGIWLDIDLGEDFRADPTGDVPVLLLSGSLDGRTYPEGQREAVAGLTDVTAVSVIGAGHNLFMTDPRIAEAMHTFMRGEPVGGSTIEVDVPDLGEVPDWARGWM